MTTGNPSFLLNTTRDAPSSENPRHLGSNQWRHNPSLHVRLLEALRFTAVGTINDPTCSDREWILAHAVLDLSAQVIEHERVILISLTNPDADTIPRGYPDPRPYHEILASAIPPRPTQTKPPPLDDEGSDEYVAPHNATAPDDPSDSRGD